MVRILIAISLLLSGCITADWSPDRYPVVLDVHMPDFGRDLEVDDSITWFNDQVGAEVFVRAEEVGLEGDLPIYGQDEGADANIGRYYPEGRIVIDTSVREDIRRAVVHELGHALGLEHDTDSNSFMYEYVCGPWERAVFSEEDKQYVLELMR